MLGARVAARHGVNVPLMRHARSNTCELCPDRVL
jgi:hypothetical protein